MLSVPAAEQLEVTVRPSGDAAAPQLAVTVATGDNQVEALLGYLTIGALNHAGLVEQQAEALLSDTSGSAAAVAGFYLLRVSNLEGLRNWPANVADLTGWMPDGAIIQAWKLLREQQEARTRSQSLLPTARALLLGAAERGTPVYMEGLRLLVMGLKLIDFAANGQDGEVRGALGRIRPYVQAAYLGQPTFIYGGSGPLSPSVSPVYGVPRLHGNLVFLWDRKVTGKEAGIFLGRSSGEGKTSGSRSPAQKAEPRRSRPRKQKVVVTIVCDFPHDGEVDATETVSFAFEGASYEIDLCSAHAREFREAFSQYIKHARRVRPVSHRRRARAGPGRERSAEIRAWAKQRGHKVSERGRIPAAIITEHESTH
jgi:hypothetical protein